jgi:hypothetical protein
MEEYRLITVKDPLTAYKSKLIDFAAGSRAAGEIPNDFKLVALGSPVRRSLYVGHLGGVLVRDQELLSRCLLLCRFSAAGNDEPLHALWRPAAEKRQGTKSRAMVQRRCRRRYGDLATGYGLRRLERSACDDRLSAK